MFTLVQSGPLDRSYGTTYDVVFDEQDEPYTVAQFVEDARKMNNVESTMFKIISNRTWFECLYYVKAHPELKDNQKVYDKLRNSRVVRAGAYQLGKEIWFGVIIEEIKE